MSRARRRWQQTKHAGAHTRERIDHFAARNPDPAYAGRFDQGAQDPLQLHGPAAPRPAAWRSLPTPAFGYRHAFGRFDAEMNADRCATASVSVIIRVKQCVDSGISRSTGSVGDPVRRLTGLKHAFPRSFCQTSARMSLLCSAQGRPSAAMQPAHRPVRTFQTADFSENQARSRRMDARAGSGLEQDG